jgi:transcription elongation factor Elf1
MPQPFTCPHCGGHDYVITLTGCNISNATVQEAFEWSVEEGDYGSSGSIIVDSEEIENEGGEAVCANCEKDVSEAIAEYEDKIVGGAAQA